MAAALATLSAERSAASDAHSVLSTFRLGFLPSLWLLAAALYATAALFLDHALYEKALMAQVAAHETVRAKQPARALDLNAAKPAPPGAHAIQPSADAGMQHLNEWVQVASYTNVVHARPSSSSPVISAIRSGRNFA